MALPLSPAPQIGQARRALTVALCAVTAVAGLAVGAAALDTSGSGSPTVIDSSTEPTVNVIPSTVAPDPTPDVPQVPTTVTDTAPAPAVEQPVTAAVADEPAAAATPDPVPVAEPVAPAPQPAPPGTAPQSPTDTSGVVPPYVPDTTPPPSVVVDCDVHPVPEGC